MLLPEASPSAREGESCLRFIRDEDFYGKIENYGNRIASPKPSVRDAVLREVIEKLYCVKTIGEFFALLGRTYKALPAMVDARGTGSQPPFYRFAQLAAVIARDAGDLERDCGIHKGTRVGILGENSLNIITSLFGCMRIGAIPVPFASRKESGQTPVEAMERGEVEMVLVGGAAAADAVCEAQASSRLGWLREHGHVKGIDVDAKMKLVHIRTAPLPERGGAEDTGVGPDDTAVSIFTSGTSGTPALERIRHRELLYPALTLPAVYAEPPGKRTLQAMPFYHIYGLTTTLAALAGGSQVFLADAETMKKRGDDVMKRARPHLMPSVPYGWKFLRARIEQRLGQEESGGGVRGRLVSFVREAIHARMIEVAREDLVLSERLGMRSEDLEEAERYWAPVLERASEVPRGISAGVRQTIGALLLSRKVLPDAGLENLRQGRGLGIGGGAKFDAETLAYLRALGIDLRPGYGATQSSITTSPNPHCREPLTFSGEPLPGLSLGADGAGSGSPHELIVMGGTVSPGTIGNGDRHSLFHTQDTGSLFFPEGNITVTQSRAYLRVGPRQNRTVKLPHGLFVDLTEYENAARRVSGVRRAIVIADGDASLQALLILEGGDSTCEGRNGHGNGSVASSYLSAIREHTKPLVERFRADIGSVRILSGVPASKDDPGGADLYSLKDEPKIPVFLKRYGASSEYVISPA